MEVDHWMERTERVGNRHASTVLVSNTKNKDAFSTAALRLTRLFIGQPLARSMLTIIRTHTSHTGSVVVRTRRAKGDASIMVYSEDREERVESDLRHLARSVCGRPEAMEQQQ
ncbi:unnamed protein product, partial [Ectocarpus sp. 12 AP-2014]